MIKRFVLFAMCLAFSTPALGQLLDERPVSTGGNPIGTWEVENGNIDVYASPELLATVSNLQFTGIITGTLTLDDQGRFESDYITTSSATLSVTILGAPIPVNVDVADTNRQQGTYSIDGSVLTLVPDLPDTATTTVSFTVINNTLRLVQRVPLGEFAATVESLVPQGGAPLAVFEMSKVVTGYTGPITADFDGSGEVGFSDFLAFAQQFGKGTGDPAFDSKFDLNANGSVDFADFLSFAQQFGLSA